MLEDSSKLYMAIQTQLEVLSIRQMDNFWHLDLEIILSDYGEYRVESVLKNSQAILVLSKV